MECSGDYTTPPGPDTMSCVNYPYCSHVGGAFYNPIPPWQRREEARHSDIPKGMARALEDGQITLYDERLYGSKLVRYPGGTPWGIMFRHPKITGHHTTQETLSFID